METPSEFYKKKLYYNDELDLHKATPLTHKGVINLITEYANQCKNDVSDRKEDFYCLNENIFGDGKKCEELCLSCEKNFK